PDENYEEIIKWCWQQNEREYQYFAMEFLSLRLKKSAANIIELYEYMIVEKSWWDTVDFISAVLVGDYFKRFPNQINTITEKWISSNNIWLQRSCLLFQLKYKSNTDVNLMESFIVQLLGSKEFFIDKAIGWILREYSKTNPHLVLDIVQKYSLSGLSHREALKWMQNKGLV
ncbi:MAG: DNA alkylation repair protein, partial [Marinilabiliales bacterium]